MNNQCSCGWLDFHGNAFSGTSFSKVNIVKYMGHASVCNFVLSLLCYLLVIVFCIVYLGSLLMYMVLAIILASLVLFVGYRVLHCILGFTLIMVKY